MMQIRMPCHGIVPPAWLHTDASFGTVSLRCAAARSAVSGMMPAFVGKGVPVPVQDSPLVIVQVYPAPVDDCRCSHCGRHSMQAGRRRWEVIQHSNPHSGGVASTSLSVIPSTVTICAPAAGQNTACPRWPRITDA